MGSGGLTTAVRLVRLMQLLERRNWSVRELASECRVSRRTIQRDLLVLQGEPFYLPLVCEGGRWGLMDDTEWRAPRVWGGEPAWMGEQR